MSDAVVTDLLQRLCAPWNDPQPAPRAAMVVAHPDDEAVGLGGRLPRLAKARFFYVTDGAPRNMHDARTYGFSTREQYAAARKAELCSALALAGIGPAQVEFLGAVDQEASFDLAGLTRGIADRLEQVAPEMVITHPYEGGHPDHDATAFAVQTACQILRERGTAAPLIVEMTSYHDAKGWLCAGCFLAGTGEDATTIQLSPEERAFKRRLFDCYRTQHAMLAQFPQEVECFRLAPQYDFSRPPHPGTLFYERFDWGMTGRRWRELASEAMSELGMARGAGFKPVEPITAIAG